MKYRKFGALDYNASVLGFGCMRFPQKDGKIDRPEATKMLHYAIDHGVNYLDTAYVYHDGESELLVGEALKGGYRDKVKLATKLPVWKVDSAQDFDRLLNEQLEKLQTESIDFYLLHALGRDVWRKMDGLGVLDWAEKAIAGGRFKHLCFSFHDEPSAFFEIVDGYDKWAMCQIQYNYIDLECRELVKYGASKGLAVVVMEPLLGGNLVNPPQPVQAIWDTASQKRTAADWALQWLWNQPEVSLILSGMSSMKQVEENLASAENWAVNVLSERELSLFTDVRELYRRLKPIPCTQCDYCKPCPNGVNIPRNFQIYNQGMMYNNPEGARGGYGWMLQAVKIGLDDHDERAFLCSQCGVCEEKCPQKIQIADWMKTVHEVLGEGKPFRNSI